EPKVGDDGSALELIRNTLAMRRGAGKDYLVFGRMERPAAVMGIDRVRWSHSGKDNDYASVFHSAWSSRGGGRAVALANWTREARRVTVSDVRLGLGREVRLVTSGPRITESSAVIGPEGMDIEVPALGCAMVIR
ncbi:MAG: hypothetical protein FWE70_07235, partial [Oscillospiraceae bacterium]|nr:hypothetical protein [Oscillospiraceae bacterium]